ncbi:hypothetical protein HanOQP8_Chr00c034g0729851 [Helianthus annuus]|nr:hypothetical protein HanOQP8_Chr00c034g0729851 [Helianthus annuus]
MSNSDDPHSPTVKSDFSMITQTIGHQLHTVASFLAPPPHQPSYSHDASPSSSYQGLKNDLAEIGDSLKTLLSPKKAVTGISKFASNLIKFDKGDVVGVTDVVVDFVREISTRPECWLDFPLSLQNQGYVFIIFLIVMLFFHPFSCFFYAIIMLER